MKILHFESGLGNQMLNYAEYLYVKNISGDDCYCEKIVYDIPECSQAINQWNGFEIDKIFQLDIPDVKDLFDERQWKSIISDVESSRFWEHDWNYAQAILESFCKQGVDLENHTQHYGHKAKKNISDLIKTELEMHCRPYAICVRNRRLKGQERDNRVKNGIALLDSASHSSKDTYCGQTLAFMFKDTGMDIVDNQVREAFRFPAFSGGRNVDVAALINNTNSVAIHARRGDFMSHNAILYTGGYFRNAVRYIKERIDNPVFFFFCDPGSIEWCKTNSNVFNLATNKDSIYFVDWNKGYDSYRDMQLMALCKHDIVTTSSFGWWASFLNENPDKITIVPDPRLRAEVSL